MLGWGLLIVNLKALNRHDMIVFVLLTVCSSTETVLIDFFLRRQRQSRIDYNLLVPKGTQMLFIFYRGNNKHGSETLLQSEYCVVVLHCASNEHKGTSLYRSLYNNISLSLKKLKCCDYTTKMKIPVEIH